MSYNAKHHTTFKALFQLWGLPPVLVEPISNQLAMIDNNIQDELIELITVELQNKQNPPQI